MKIAYLSSQVTQPGSPIRRSDAFEHDYMMRALRPEFAERGMEINDICWDDDSADWASFDAALIGTTWDYWDRQAEFLSTLEAIESRTRLFNPAALVRWNSDKTYLKDLADRGANLIPTLWIDVMTDDQYQGAFDALGRRFKDGAEQIHQFGGIGVFQGYHGDFLTDSGNVNGVYNSDQSFDVGIYIRNDQCIGGGVGQYDAALGYHGGEQPLDFRHVGIFQGNQLGNDFVFGIPGFLSQTGFNVF